MLARERRHAEVGGSATLPDASENWHRVRIDAKQLRYACEAVEPMFGKPARELAQHAERVQEALGEHQDAVIAADVLHSMATAKGAGTDGVYARTAPRPPDRAAAAAQAEFARVWADASRPKPSRLRRWLTP